MLTEQGDKLFICFIVFERKTYCLNFWRTLWSGVPNTSWILATWSNSLVPGKRGFKLQHTGKYSIIWPQQNSLHNFGSHYTSIWIVQLKCSISYRHTSWSQRRHNQRSRCPSSSCNIHQWGDTLELCTTVWRCTQCAGAWSTHSDMSQSLQASEHFAASCTQYFFKNVHNTKSDDHWYSSLKKIYDKLESHFDENVLWLHISVKDPTAVKEEKWKKLLLLYNFYCIVFVIFS